MFTSTDSDRDNKRYRTAPATPGRQMSISGQVTKPRVSPRGLVKKDYKMLEDPFVGKDATDGEGNLIFDESALENEDDDSSDEYEKKEKSEEVEVKAEDVGEAY